MLEKNLTREEAIQTCKKLMACLDLRSDEDAYNHLTILMYSMHSWEIARRAKLEQAFRLANEPTD